MQKSLLFITLFSFMVCSQNPAAASNLMMAQAANLNSPELLAERCRPEDKSETFVRSSDFHWNYALQEMIDKYKEFYFSPRRLEKRNYWDAQTEQLYLPFDSGRGGAVAVPESFIQSIVRHVEEAFRMNYIDGVFFPDMGHSHFLIPEEKYMREYRNQPIAEMSRTYEKFFADQELKVVYHTAEQLRITDENSKILDDRRLQWRFFSRNIVGDNRGEGRLELAQNPEHRHNTLGGMPGYYWWGAGFNIHASQSACIAYVKDGKVEYFDLSLYDLVSASGGDFMRDRLPR